MYTFIHFSVLLVLTATLAAPATGEVYKRTNPDGSVEFTDIPRSDTEKPVPLSPMSTFKATPVPQKTAPVRSRADADTYSNINIVSPADETTIRDNAGTVRINVSLSPVLRPEHKLVLLVDGEQKGESASGSFILNNLDRGSHSLAARVLDKSGKTLISAAPVTIYLFRESIIKAKRVK